MAFLTDIEIAQQCEMKHICEIAKKANTINYEIICNINSRVTRVYMKNGKVESAFGYLLSE